MQKEHNGKKKEEKEVSEIQIKCTMSFIPNYRCMQRLKPNFRRLAASGDADFILSGCICQCICL